MSNFTIGSVSLAFGMILSACGGVEDAGVPSSLASVAETTVLEPTESRSTDAPDGTEIATSSDPGEFTVESLLADIEGGVTNGVAEFDVERRVVELDDDDDHPRSVSMLLPVEATVSVGSFKTEITLSSDLSIFSDLTVKDGCDGICAPKDWEAELTGLSGYIGRRRAGMVVDHDSPIPGGWILTGWDDDEYVVLVTRWNDDASHYFSCLGELDDDDARYANDVIAMCVSADPSWLD